MPPLFPTLSVAHEVRAIAPAGDAGLAWVRKRLDMARLSIDDVLSDRDAAPFHEILNDTQRLTDQIERLQAQLAAQQAVIDAARQRLASADAAWLELGLTVEDTPELVLQIDPNGHWATLRAALAALDKAQAAQPEGERAG